MNIDVRLFALARQLAGKPTVRVLLPDSATVGDLRIGLAREIPPLGELLPKMMIAVGPDYADDAQILQADSDVALIPPVSGGCDG